MIIVPAKEAIELLKDIPEEKWCTDYIKKDGKMCFRGHLSMAKLNDIKKTVAVEVKGIYSEFPYVKMILVNDGIDEKYQQETPKQRVMAFLNDLLNK